VQQALSMGKRSSLIVLFPEDTDEPHPGHDCRHRGLLLPPPRPVSAPGGVRQSSGQPARDSRGRGPPIIAEELAPNGVRPQQVDYYQRRERAAFTLGEGRGAIEALRRLVALTRPRQAFAAMFLSVARAVRSAARRKR